ncbi:hypothetical protein CLV32_0935 [Pedobacter duraquae]|uniref:Uncharacterized protein n=1 Tax=Pedobacter duraquae TaxID=425511 RepID=A0A4R6IQQ9_9SPHI|nr:hypothetical protein CLV32_0935 [Pedobacter duraquae]
MYYWIYIKIFYELGVFTLTPVLIPLSLHVILIFRAFARKFYFPIGIAFFILASLGPDLSKQTITNSEANR